MLALLRLTQVATGFEARDPLRCLEVVDGNLLLWTTFQCFGYFARAIRVKSLLPYGVTLLEGCFWFVSDFASSLRIRRRLSSLP